MFGGMTGVEGLDAAKAIGAALAIGQCRPWLPLLESALVEIGLAAIDDILMEAEHEHRDDDNHKKNP